MKSSSEMDLTDEIKFGKRIKKYREVKKLTAKEMANQLGVAASTYREWEMGRAIQGLYYTKLAEILEVSLSELFGLSMSKNTNLTECLTFIQEIEKRIRQMLANRT